MPPISTFSYRVLFYYSAYRTHRRVLEEEGKYWAKKRDKFIGPGGAVNAAVNELVLPSDTPEQKLRKIYAAVQKLENTDFTRNHSGAEEKSQGLGEIKSTDDIWNRKRGTDDQLTELFVAMARAAGIKAYLMSVADRSQHIFFPTYLSFSQLDDDIAIVNVDGKDRFFDPGSSFCSYGHLAWKHTMSSGIRQADGGSAIAHDPHRALHRHPHPARRQPQHGGGRHVSGTVKMTYTGAPALQWRQVSLEGDDESLRRDLRTSMEEFASHGLEIKLTGIEQLTDYEQPLSVIYDVKGVLGSATGKRLILPGDLFEANTRTAFPHEKRDIGIYFEYGHIVQDAIRISLPKDFLVESLPAGSKLEFENVRRLQLSPPSPLPPASPSAETTSSVRSSSPPRSTPDSAPSTPAWKPRISRASFSKSSSPGRRKDHLRRELIPQSASHSRGATIPVRALVASASSAQSPPSRLLLRLVLGHGRYNGRACSLFYRQCPSNQAALLHERDRVVAASSRPFPASSSVPSFSGTPSRESPSPRSSPSASCTLPGCSACSPSPPPATPCAASVGPACSAPPAPASRSAPASS